MSKDSVVRARIDAGTKEKATKALEAMGLSVSDAIRLLMTRVAQEERLPFDIKVPTPATKRAMRDLEERKAQRFKSVDEMFEDLDG